MAKVSGGTYEERYAAGKALRRGCPREAHARWKTPAAFDKALASFAVAYADQNEKDHAALDRAVRRGKVKAVFEEAR
ncbi:MAG TPA: DUF2252 family protein [Candidatus Polarisedimenticolaceae bacterium]|nr:DUF2252 family protein [Candidatus Polarisedimenticolaceae bacterium]